MFLTRDTLIIDFLKPSLKKSYLKKIYTFFIEYGLLHKCSEGRVFETPTLCDCHSFYDKTFLPHVNELKSIFMPQNRHDLGLV